MFSIKLLISGVDYSQYAVYPFTFTEKNIDDSLNIYELTLKHTPFEKPFKPNQRVVLEVYQDNIFKDRIFLLTLSDSVQKVGRRSLFDHEMTMIEFTNELEQTILPDMSITRISVGENLFLPTLKDAAEKVLFVGNLNITLATETAAILDEIESPEWTFTRQTVLEALRLIFAVAQITPTLITPGRLGHVGIEGFVPQSTIENYAAFEAAYDPETYKSAIYSNVDFMRLKEDFETVVEPREGWVSTRSPDGIRITNDNAIIPTTRPIDRLERLDIRFLVDYRPTLVIDGMLASPNVYWFDSDIIGQEFFRDFGDFVFEESRYDVLPDTNQIEYDLETDSYEIGKGSALFFTQGQKNIYGLGGIAPARWSLFPNRQSILEVLTFLTGSPADEIYPEFPNVAVSSAFIKRDKIQPLLNKLLDLIKEIEGTQDIVVTEHVLRPVPYEDGKHMTQDLAGPFTGIQWNTPDVQSRVQYRPYINTDIISFSPVQSADQADEITSVQYYNQQNNDVDSRALAELHDKVIKRGRGNNLIYTLLNKDYDELIDVGKRVDKFVLSGANHVIDRNHILTDYTLSETFAKLNKYVAVLERYRQFSVPQENIVKRQISENIFAKFETAPNEEVTLLASDYIGTKQGYVLQIIPENDSNNIQYFPTTHYPFNNQIRFEVELPTNSKSGDRTIDFVPEPSLFRPNPQPDPGSRVSRPILHIDENGFLEEASIKLVEKMRGDNEVWEFIDSHNLPLRNIQQDTLFYEKIKTIKKDSREQLRFVLAVHHIENTQQGRFTNLWAKQIGLIDENAGLNSNNIKLAFLNIPFDLDRNLVSSGEIIQSYNMGSLDFPNAGPPSLVEFKVLNNSILLPRGKYANPGPAQSWAILTEENKVLYWFDEVVEEGFSNQQVYINFYENYNTPLKYTVIFQDDDGTILSTQQVPFGEGAVAPVDPEKPGFIFTGWDKDFSVILEDLVVTAQYFTAFSITYNLDGATNNPNNPDEYASEQTPITLLPPTKQGFVFIGWSPSNIIPESSTGPLEFTAIFGEKIAEKVISVSATATAAQTAQFQEATASLDISVIGSGTAALTAQFLESEASVNVLVDGTATGALTAQALEGEASQTITVDGSGTAAQTAQFLEGEASQTITIDGSGEAERTAEFQETEAELTIHVHGIAVASKDQVEQETASLSITLTKTAEAELTAEDQEVEGSKTINITATGEAELTAEDQEAEASKEISVTGAAEGELTAVDLEAEAAKTITVTGSGEAEEALDSQEATAAQIITLTSTAEASKTLKDAEATASKTITVIGSGDAEEALQSLNENASKTITLTLSAEATKSEKDAEATASKTISVTTTAEGEELITDLFATASKTISLTKSVDATGTTAIPSFESLSSTTSSVSFRIRNNEAAQVTVRYRLNANPIPSSPSVTIAAGGLSNTLTFSGLNPNQTYNVRADAIRTDGTKDRSPVGTQNITTQQETTATPSTRNAGVTLSTATFEIRNEDSTSNASMTYRIVRTSDNFVLDQGTVTGPFNQWVSVGVIGLAQGTQVRLENVRATVTGKLQSGLATTRTQTTLVQTATPGTSAISSTSSSVTFALTNNDNTTANVTWEIRQGSTGGTIVASGTESIPGFNGTQVSATGLSPSTTYFLTNVFATATGKTQSAAGTVRSIATLAPPTLGNIVTSSNANPSDTANFVFTNNNGFNVSLDWQTGSSGLSTVTGTSTIPANSTITISRQNILATPQTIAIQWTASASGFQSISGSMSQGVTATLDDTTTT